MDLGAAHAMGTGLGFVAARSWIRRLGAVAPVGEDWRTRHCGGSRNGDCAPRDHWVTGPKIVTFDLSAVKRTTLVGHTNFEFRADLLNAFNNINYTAVAQTGNSATIDQITAAQRDVNNTQNPGGRLIQFVFRLTF